MIQCAKGCKEILLPSKLPKCAMTNLCDLMRLSGCCLLHCNLYSLASHAGQTLSAISQFRRETGGVALRCPWSGCLHQSCV